MRQAKLINLLKVAALALGLGAAVGLVLWLFLRVVALGSTLIWQTLPGAVHGKWITVPLCALAGLAAGLLRRRYGDYPESLETVMGKMKRDKYYDYANMLPMLGCAVLPLIAGASVGPEAGLTGIISALCYWVGDNVTFARQNAGLYSQLGEAVTLGQLFHMPLFGILAVEEQEGDEDAPQALPRAQKLVLYGLAAAGGFLAMALLNRLFHTSVEGFPKFAEATIQAGDYLMVLLYIPIGFLLCLLFEGAERLAKRCAGFVPDVAREVICGAGVALVGLAVPMALFSGEEQMATLMESPAAFGAWALIGLCLLKLVLTAFCLSFGMKGGHFFPLIFACVCMGYGLTGLFFGGAMEHAAFAGAVLTASALGAQMKKPLAVSALLLLCFPPRLLLWIFVAAALASQMTGLLRREGE